MIILYNRSNQTKQKTSKVLLSLYFYMFKERTNWLEKKNFFFEYKKKILRVILKQILEYFRGFWYLFFVCLFSFRNHFFKIRKTVRVIILKVIVLDNCGFQILQLGLSRIIPLQALIITVLIWSYSSIPSHSDPSLFYFTFIYFSPKQDISKSLDLEDIKSFVFYFWKISNTQKQRKQCNRLNVPVIQFQQLSIN